MRPEASLNPGGEAANESFDREVICRGKPMVELRGREGAFVVTDVGELIAVGPEARELTPFAVVEGAGAPSTRLFLASAAALDLGGEPVLGTSANQIAWFRRGAWEVKAHPAPVLALGSSRAGVVAGDSAGELTVFDGRRVAGLHAGEPVVEILAVGDRLGVLGGGGGLWTTRWPHDDAGALTAIETGRVGRPFGLFAAKEGFLGVFGARRAALVDLARGRITATSLDLGEIRAITSLDDGEGYAVLTDAGEVSTLDSGLRTPRGISLPSKGGAAVGVRSVGGGALLVWTQAGELFSVHRSGLARRIADDGVALAYPTRDGACVVVHTTATGLRLRTERWS
ncbi:MAG: hypothetical protein ABJE95_13190 [Byssovorax sp.]